MAYMWSLGTQETHVEGGQIDNWLPNQDRYRGYLTGISLKWRESYPSGLSSCEYKQ